MLEFWPLYLLTVVVWIGLVAMVLHDVRRDPEGLGSVGVIHVAVTSFAFAAITHVITIAAVSHA